MWLIIRTTRQHIQQRDVANYTDDKHTTKRGGKLYGRQDIQQRDVVNYTDDKRYNKEMWLIIRLTRDTTKRSG